jgi:hypothetical protein
MSDGILDLAEIEDSGGGKQMPNASGPSSINAQKDEGSMILMSIFEFKVSNDICLPGAVVHWSQSNEQRTSEED